MNQVNFIEKYGALLTLALMVGVCSYGFLHIEMLNPPAWTKAGLWRFLAVTVLFWGASAAIILVAPRLYLYFLFTAIATVAASRGIAPPVTVIAITCSSWLIGNRILSRFSHLDPLITLLYIPLGLGGYILLTFALAHTGLMYQQIAFIALIAPLIIWKRQLSECFSRIKLIFGQPTTRPDAIKYGVLMYFASLYLFLAMIPETGHDGLGMHLMIADYVTNHHKWDFDFTRLVWALFPMNGDWAYALAYNFGGEYASRQLNAVILLLVSWQLFQVVGHEINKNNAIYAVVMHLTLPLTFLLGGSLFVESIWTLYIFSAFTVLLLYKKTGEHGLVLLLAALLGFAISCKLTTALIIPGFIFLLIGFFYKNFSAKLVGYVAGAISIFLIIGSYPYVEAFLKTGNPVFPLFNAVFKSPYFPLAANFDNAIYHQGLSASTLYNLSFRSSNYLEGSPGAFGFQFLLLLPAGVLISIATRSNAIARQALLLAGIYFILLFQFQAYIRYLAPVVPLAIIICMTLFNDNSKQSRISTAPFHIVFVLSTALNLCFLPSAGWISRGFRIDTLLSDDNTQEFIRREAPERHAVSLLNAINPGTVGVIAKPMMAGLHSPYLLANWYNTKFLDDLNSIYDQASFARLIQNNKITHWVIDTNMVDSRVFKHITNNGNLLQQFGSVSVYEVRKEIAYTRENLLNPRLSNDLAHWNKIGSPEFSPGEQGFIVNNTNFLIQPISVNGNSKYLLEMEVKCLPGNQAIYSLHIDWGDAKGKYIDSDVKSQLCVTQYAIGGSYVTAPENAGSATVYAVSQSPQPVLIRSVSLKSFGD